MSQYTCDKQVYNQSGNEPFTSVLEKHLSRRSIVKGGLGAAFGMMAGFSLTGCLDSGGGSSHSDTPAPAPSVSLGFESIPGARLDALAVATGYTAQVLAPWGTPLNSMANAWQQDGSNTPTDQLNAVGMHHDGMRFFPIDGSSDEGLLAINFEYIDQNALHPAGATSVGGVRPVDEVRKEIYAHGAGVIHIRRTDGVWSVVEGSRYNRRFTTASVMNIAGPMRNSSHLVTPFSINGTQTRGTNNNCGNGYTPWGTYLTCEENWPGVFRNTGTLPADQSRIGIRATSNYRWESAAGDPSEENGEFARFDVTASGASSTDDYRNEASGYGYIVEIDPFNPDALAVKRTALGRFRHEGCWPGLVEVGKPVTFYMGDDAQFEYLYKFVSAANWEAADATPSNPLATGAKYMDEGTLYVARFDEDGSGVWLPLTEDSETLDGRTLGSIYGDLATIILNTRSAADALGATPMDRPEWTTVNPLTGDCYLTLTNNSARTSANAANPRVPNINGHIVRWHDDETGTRFDWDIFVFGSNADAAPDTNRSGLTDLNQFASPDGMTFDSRGILWIETDNSGNEVAAYTNDQLLAVVPAQIVDADGNPTVISADNQDLLRRFLVGPNGCEVTGITFTPDLTSMFVNIQHPGNWPSYDSIDATEVTSGTVRPRASTVVIQRTDGGAIGV